ncbi:class I SAM-dependent methyltransferase [Promicromonospora thailandica]|uniref:Methyltransferase domain-containing protein n=1 Tax=Promicromonospora thailandica TaxID=765201 RepID=A0A9X2JV19_9MICO|nr:class I SAM-dependent methyltransferase [Promicromonospora thailandica]MCP2264092.1 Methyltransferase domain-containing protein [Promicromonospora thailandica]
MPADPWSDLADDWDRSWGTFARPVWAPLLDAAGIGPGTRVLDVGCGTGALLAHLRDQGARPSGVDPAARMAELAQARAPGVDVRRGEFEDLPFDDAAFDAVLAVNAFQLADPDEALAEAARVLAPGGVLGLAGWAERARNDLDALDTALAVADGEEPPEDGPLRVAGGLAGALADARWEVLDVGLTTVPWTAAHDDDLVSGVLLGEDPATVADLAPVVLAAAAPYRRADGSYLFRNAFRWAVGRAPAG